MKIPLKTRANFLAAGIFLTALVNSFGQPIITTEPQSQTNVVGTDATFTVVATGTEPMAYQWRLGVAELAGKTNDTLILTNVQAANAGSYVVVVTNLTGAVTSVVATLTVLVPPTITSQPVGRAVAAGAEVTLNVFATGSSPLSYQWRKDGVDLPGATTRMLTRSPVQLTNAGSYTAVVANLAGAVTSRVAQLSVAQVRVYTNGQGERLEHVLFLPTNYDSAKQYPLVLYWHGSGQATTDDNGQFVFLSATNQTMYPCFYLAPQIPQSEGDCDYFFGIQDQTVEVLNLLQAEFSIDPERLYLTGFSMGGFVAWGMLARFPNLFAAAVPMAGGWPCANLMPPDSFLNIRVPLWNFHAANDGVVDVQGSDYAVSSLRSVGGNPIYTRYILGGHSIPQTAYSTPGLVDWVMAQKRGVTAPAPPLVTITAPTAAAGYVTALSALDVAGTAAHYTNLLRVDWTNIMNQAGGMSFGTNDWSATAIPLQVNATNLIVITAWATNNISGFRGNTTFNTTLAVVCWPIRATLTLVGTSTFLNWTGGQPPYCVQRTTNLVTSDWTAVVSNAVPPLSLPLEGAAGFYRIIGQ